MVRAELEDIAVASDGSYYLILLKTESGEFIPITIDALQAQAIVRGKLKESFPRPMTHDLMLSIIEMLNASIKRIEITDLAHDTFYARLILDNRGIEFDIDARPSDALALAVRIDVPLYVSKEVIEKASLKDDLASGGSGGFEA
jgi:hypothetical protein